MWFRAAGIAVLIATLALCFQVSAAPPADAPAVRVSEGSLDIPTYTHTGRELQPALFGSSTVGGLYPFPQFIMPFTPESPRPRTYKAIFLENEYLKLTYLPELGGRFFSLFDKVNNRDVFYRNDVIKPAAFNSKLSWPQTGIELTGPFDTHMLTLYGEPFWSNKIVRHEDGSVSLVLGSIDPVYHMKVDLAARLYPGLSAIEIRVFCYNGRDGRMPQMFWVSASLPTREKTQFIYPMTRTIGHTTSDVAGWPLYNGVDYTWDRNNKHMLGVFGIDIYDNFQGAYHHDIDYGTFRYADRRVVTGMKMWTFGHSGSAVNVERTYTDKAGPYIEVQSGRHVWDGHYEWVGPHKFETWHEWWFPVSGIGGFTTTSRDVALNLEVKADPLGKSSEVTVGLSANRQLPGARVTVTASTGEILSATADLAPGKPCRKTVSGIAADAGGLTAMAVRVTDASGKELLDYHRPDENPGRKEYTPFTASLEEPRKEPGKMSIEELVLMAEFKLKEMNTAAAVDLLNKALERDQGFSRAHLLLGIYYFNEGRYDQAAKHLKKAVERDPYLDEAYYYLSASLFQSGEEKTAERNLYYIPPMSGYFANREYLLGRLEFLRGETEKAAGHLEQAVQVNGYYMDARILLAVIDREGGHKERALERLAEIETIDPTSAWAAAERYFLARDSNAQAELLRLLGGQSQEAIDVSLLYRKLRRWKEAVEILELVEKNNKDVWGTPPEFYYTLAYCLNKAGETQKSTGYLAKARKAAGNVDRFPYREENEAVFAEAIERDPKDSVARFSLACLLYHRGRTAEATQQWEAAVSANPRDFGSHRALGLAYAEQDEPLEKAAAQLEKAIEIDPGHVRTLNDLSSLYSRSGRFHEQIALLKRAIDRSPGDDNLVEGLVTANLIMGRYADADGLIQSHKFGIQHRTYGLRDKYRFLHYAMGAAAFHKGDYPEALKQYQTSLNPPVSLGVDDFAFESTPRVHYYIGRTLEAMGRTADARAAYEKGASGSEKLAGGWDSFNSENFHMALSLEKLGKTQEAAKLLADLGNFAQSQLESRAADRKAASRYLLALVKRHEGQATEARRLIEEAVKIEPDALGPRLELHGDVIDPLAN